MTFAAKKKGRIVAVKPQPGPKVNAMATIAKFVTKDKTEPGTVHWLNECIGRGKTETFAATVEISPGLASVILGNNPHNRNLSQRKVDQYARDMIDGRWTFNGEPIIFGDTGELNDGQHRLHGVILANRSQLFLVVFGVPRASRTTVDQGMARTAGHYLAMDGVENAQLVASIANFAIAYEASGGTLTKADNSHAAIVARVKADNQIAEAAVFTNNVRKFARGMLTPAQIGGCYYLFAELSEADAAEYLTQVCVGENIKRGDPAFTVRQSLGEMRGERRNDRVEAVMRGWVAFRQNRKLHHIKILNAYPALV